MGRSIFAKHEWNTWETVALGRGQIIGFYCNSTEPQLVETDLDVPIVSLDVSAERDSHLDQSRDFMPTQMVGYRYDVSSRTYIDLVRTHRSKRQPYLTIYVASGLGLKSRAFASTQVAYWPSDSSEEDLRDLLDLGSGAIEGNAVLDSTNVLFMPARSTYSDPKPIVLISFDSVCCIPGPPLQESQE